VYDHIANSSTLSQGFDAAECPVLALFDICNAFPSIAHVWLFAVLRCLKISPEIINIILHLYSNCAAYSCGIGTGDLLFYVLAGVRTGCPMSANLFLLGFNPFVFLINHMSDGPKVAKTCICADDVGSALRALKHLKKQYMIWKIASKVAGLVLKPSKCFLVVTRVPLTPVVKQAIETWIRNEIPAWKHMQVVDHGKYLGVFLGVGGVQKTFKGCEEKYLSRCFDISLSVATALPTIVRYNERAVPVFGYISQVLLHPDIPKLKRLEQRGIHKILKLPPNSMSQKLTHSFGEFCPLVPRPIFAMSIAAHSRFAKAEEKALRSILAEAIDILGDSNSLYAHALHAIPCGHLGDLPLIKYLVDSLDRKGVYLQFSQQLCIALVTKGRSPLWSQAWFTNIYAGSESLSNIQSELGSKILKTFESDIAYSLYFPGNWYNDLIPILRYCKPYVGMCIFKTYIGGWTTSSRMHERDLRSCLLGCCGACDNINHYMQCSPLWQIACGALGVVDPFDFSKRLCIVSPSPDNAQLLALVFSLYHSAHHSFPSDVVGPSPAVVQKNLVEAARAYRPHIV